MKTTLFTISLLLSPALFAQGKEQNMMNKTCQTRCLKAVPVWAKNWNSLLAESKRKPIPENTKQSYKNILSFLNTKIFKTYEKMPDASWRRACEVKCDELSNDGGKVAAGITGSIVQ